MDDDPTDLAPFAPISRLMRWELHPMWRMILYDISQNRKAFGPGTVYKPNPRTPQEKAIAIKDAFTYLLLESYRFYGELDRAVDEDIMSKMERHRQHEIIKDSMPLMERILFKNIGYVYSRPDLTLRRNWKYGQIDRIYNAEIARTTSEIARLTKYKMAAKDEDKKEIDERIDVFNKEMTTWTQWYTDAYDWVGTKMK